MLLFEVAMETRITIVWDGDTPGLKEHRLSLAEFSPALKSMLVAMRRIASGIVTQAEEVGDAGSRRGRLANLAKQLDLEITGVEEGSLSLVLACVLRLAPMQNAELLARLADQTCTEFVAAIEQETTGQLRNDSVRKFLRALPAGITTQSYSVRRSDGVAKTVTVGQMALATLPADITIQLENVRRSDGVEKTVTVGQMALATLPAEAPSLQEVTASIVGAGFEPGRLEVRLQDSESKRQLTCAATAGLVNTALELRAKPVRALVVESAGKLRLLRLRLHDAAPLDLTAEKQDELLWQRWDEVLRRFAQ